MFLSQQTHTQIPYRIWDMENLSGTERLVITHLLRETIGRGKIGSRISISEFEVATQVDRSAVVAAISKLMYHALITSFQAKGDESKSYSILGSNVFRYVSFGYIEQPFISLPHETWDRKDLTQYERLLFLQVRRRNHRRGSFEEFANKVMPVRMMDVAVEGLMLKKIIMRQSN